MSFSEILRESLGLLISFDAALWEIIFLSLWVSLIALFVAMLMALAVGLLVALREFYGKSLVILILNGMMGLPPVFIGLLLYLLFSRHSVFGFTQLLYTPSIMIIAQALLIFPIIAALSVELLSENYRHYRPLFHNLHFGFRKESFALLYELRYQLLILPVAGLGRGLSEVGAVIIVGGNIEHFTRTITTSIVLETSRGNLSFAFALGLILVLLGIMLNAILLIFKQAGKKFHYA